MKKLSLLIFVFIYASAMTLEASAKKSFYWFVAASFSKPAMKIAEKFNSSDKDYEVLVITGGSGELAAQITLTGKGDLFTPASEEFLTLANKKDIVRGYSKFIKQTPVFAVAKKYKNKRITFDELVNGKYRIAVGNPRTMAIADTFLSILKKMPKEETDKLRKQESVYPANINQSLSYLETNSVDAALIFKVMAVNASFDYILIPDEYNIDCYSYMVSLKSEFSEERTDDFIAFIYRNKDVFSDMGYEIYNEHDK